MRPLESEEDRTSYPIIAMNEKYSRNENIPSAKGSRERSANETKTLLPQYLNEHFNEPDQSKLVTINPTNSASYFTQSQMSHHQDHPHDIRSHSSMAIGGGGNERVMLRGTQYQPSRIQSRQRIRLNKSTLMLNKQSQNSSAL